MLGKVVNDEGIMMAQDMRTEKRDMATLTSERVGKL